MKKKSKKWLIWTVVILIPVVITAVTLSSGSNDEENGRAKVKVTRENIVEKALAVGSIEPVTEIDVKSKVSGVVGKLYANVGDFVRAGDPLLEVKPDPTPLELAQAKRNVEMASIEMKTLIKELERSKQLQSEGLISDQENEVLIRQYDESKLRIR